MQILNKREQRCLYLFQTKEMLNQKSSQGIRKNYMIKNQFIKSVSHLYT